jgi:hypothetical protein
MPRGGKIKTELREKIKKLLGQGKSQAEIGRIIDRAPGTITHYVRALGIPGKKYSTPLPKKRGKRRCVSCRTVKTLGAFPSPRNATCTVCIRAKV